MDESKATFKKEIEQYIAEKRKTDPNYGKKYIKCRKCGTINYEPKEFNSHFFVDKKFSPLIGFSITHPCTKCAEELCWSDELK